MLAAFVLSLLAALPDALLALWLMLLGRGRPRHSDRGLVRLAAVGLASPPSARGSCAPSAPACSGASATRSRSRWSRTSPGSRRRSRRSRTRSVPTISIGSRCCATRSSCSTTCTCRCSPPGLDPPARSHGRAAGLDPPWLALLAVFAIPTVLTSTWRPAVERAAQERGAQSQPACAASVHDCRPPPRLAKTSASPASAPARHGPTRRPGSDGTDRSPPPDGDRRLAHAGVGGLRRRVCRRHRLRRLGPRRRPGDVLLVLAAGARLSAYIGATVGEIGFLRGIWMDGSSRLAWLEDYAASLVAHGRRAGAGPAARGHPLRARLVPLSRHRPARARRRQPRPAGRARSSPSSARTAPARRRWSSCWPSSTSRRGAASWSTTSSSRACRRTDGASRLAGAFQDFFRFELRARQTVGVGDVARVWTTSPPSSPPSSGPAPTMSSPGCRRARHAARPDLAGRRRGVLRPVAEARAGPRLHARRAAAAGARRADRGARRRDRACAVRALRRAARRRDDARTGPAADDGRITVSCPTASRRCGWPTSSSSWTARGLSRRAPTRT